MKDFVKMTLATLLGLMIFGFVSIFMSIVMIGAIAALGETEPVMPREGVLQINMADMTLSEQAQEADPFASLTGGSIISSVGIYDAIKAVNAAATDPAVKFIYMKPDGAAGGVAQLDLESLTVPQFNVVQNGYIDACRFTDDIVFLQFLQNDKRRIQAGCRGDHRRHRFTRCAVIGLGLIRIHLFCLQCHRLLSGYRAVQIDTLHLCVALCGTGIDLLHHLAAGGHQPIGAVHCGNGIGHINFLNVNINRIR